MLQCFYSFEEMVLQFCRIKTFLSPFCASTNNISWYSLNKITWVKRFLWQEEYQEFYTLVYFLFKNYVKQHIHFKRSFSCNQKKSPHNLRQKKKVYETSSFLIFGKENTNMENDHVVSCAVEQVSEIIITMQARSLNT